MNKTIKKTLRDVKEFVISRAKWARSFKDRYNSDTGMLNDDGGQCCLGIYASACQVPPEFLLGKGIPADVVVSLKDIKWNTKLVKDSNLNLIGELIDANDRSGIADSTREKKIRALFKKLGITVHFTK